MYGDSQEEAFPIVLVDAIGPKGKPKYSSPLVRARAARLGARRHETAQLATARTAHQVPVSPGNAALPAASPVPAPSSRQQGRLASTKADDDDPINKDSVRTLPSARHVRRLSRQKDRGPVPMPTAPLSPPSSECLERDAMYIYDTEVAHIYFKILSPALAEFSEALSRRPPWPRAGFEMLISNSSTFHAYCAFAFLVLEDLQQRVEPQTVPAGLGRCVSHRIAVHSTRSIQQLRKDHRSATSSGADDSTIAAISCLGAVAVKLGDFRQRDWHRKAIGQMVKQRGGLSAIGVGARSSILSTEYFWAMETGDTAIEDLHVAYGLPLQDASDSTTPGNECDNAGLDSPSTGECLPVVNARAMPQGLAALAHAGLLSNRVCTTVTRIARYQRRRASTREPPQSAATNSSTVERSGTSDPVDEEEDLAPIHENLFDAMPEVFGPLYTTPRSGNHPPVSRTPNMTVLVSLGLLLYSQIAFTAVPFWHTMTVWPLPHRSRTSITDALIGVLSSMSLQSSRPVQPSSRSLRNPPEEPSGDAEGKTAVDDALLWLATLTIASWKTASGLVAARGLTLAAAVSRYFEAEYANSCEILPDDFDQRQNWLCGHFLWESEKFDLALVETSIRACAAARRL